MGNINPIEMDKNCKLKVALGPKLYGLIFPHHR